MAAKRDVLPILQFVREKLMRRKNVNFLRFADTIAARTQPPPNLPDGPNCKLSANYYYTRDARRLVTTDETIAEGGKIFLGTGECSKSAVQRTPGKVHLWDA